MLTFDKTQTQLNNIMDVCIKKSNRTHMLQLRQINQVLKENQQQTNQDKNAWLGVLFTL